MDTSILSKFKDGFNNKLLSDVELVLKKPNDPNKKRKLDSDTPFENQSSYTTMEYEESIYLSKLLLSAHSSFFNAMLTGNFKEAASNRVHLELDPQEWFYFKDMIKFLYTGKFETPFNEIFRVLHLADKYAVELVIKEICKIITKETLSLEECCDILDELPTTVGKNNNYEELLKHVRTVIKNAHEDLDDEKVQESFLNVNWRAAICILSNPKARAFSENSVFQLVKQWILKDEATRVQYAHLILHLVRYPLMTPDFLHCVVSNNDIFNKLDEEQSSQLRGMVVEGLYYAMSNQEMRTTFTDLRTEFRKLAMNPRPDMFSDERRYVKFDWETIVPEGTEEVRSDRFFVHGYWLYLNLRKEEVNDGSVAVTLHIDSKRTGIRNTLWHMTQMHYKLYFMNLETKSYVGVGIVDHYWSKDSGWGKSVKSPGKQFIEEPTNKVKLRVFVSLGKSPLPLSFQLPVIQASS